MITRKPFPASAPLMIFLGACGQSADPETVLETVRATERAQMEAIASKANVMMKMHAKTLSELVRMVTIAQLA